MTSIAFSLTLATALAVAATDESAATSESKDKPAAAKPAASAEGRPTLNDELLKGLGPDPLAEPAPADDETKAQPADASKSAGGKPEDKPPSTKPAAKRIGDPLDDELLKGLDSGQDVPAEGEESDPFLRLNRQMRKVESLIAQSKLDPATQQLQQKIVKDLEDLIKQIQQQKSSASSAKSNGQQQTARRERVQQPGAQGGKSGDENADQPAKDSSRELRDRQAQRPDLAQWQDLLGKGVWGQLPARVREQMLQSSVDHFLPKYELLIEEYFKSIATPGENKR